MSIETATWLGEEFSVYDFDSIGWKDLPGVYILMRYYPRDDEWEFLYAGKTGSFANRLRPGHHEWDAAARRGATHVHAKVVRLDTARTRLERTLIREYDPPLNDTR